MKTNPTSKFVTTRIDKDGSGYRVTGELTLLGKTKAITFPAQISLTGGTLNLTSKFTIDRTQWGMTYGRGKVDDEVTLAVKIAAKK
ncbi:MAG: YceI family protein [Gemmataceae bacterium]|nr:YceI family protein [Gemmataceae bacterium]